MLTAPGSPVYLRALEAQDLERLHRWHNDPALYATLAGTYRPVSVETERAWLAAASSGAPGAVNLAVCATDGGEHVGNAYLRDVDVVNRRAELHVFLGDEARRGQGLGRAAVELLVGYAFDHLNLERVWLQVLASNAAALAVYERCGFAREGVLRRHVFNAGAWEDVVVMGRLRG